MHILIFVIVILSKFSTCQNSSNDTAVWWGIWTELLIISTIFLLVVNLEMAGITTKSYILTGKLFSMNLYKIISLVLHSIFICVQLCTTVLKLLIQSILNIIKQHLARDIKKRNHEFTKYCTKTREPFKPLFLSF